MIVIFPDKTRTSLPYLKYCEIFNKTPYIPKLYHFKQSFIPEIKINTNCFTDWFDNQFDEELVNLTKLFESQI